MSPHWQFHRGARHVNYVSNYILGTTSKTQAEQTLLLQQIIRKKRATEREGYFTVLTEVRVSCAYTYIKTSCTL